MINVNSSEALRAYFNRVRPMCAELFNIAYAICGDYGLAEYCLQCALTDGWLNESSGGMGLREGLRNTLKRVAVEEARAQHADPPELTWDAFGMESEDAVLGAIAQENVETRRMVALKYGCGFTRARVARMLGVPQGDVSKALARVESRVRRRLPQRDKRQAETLIQKTVRLEMRRADGDMPSMSAIYRAFESEAGEIQKPNRLPARILRHVATALLVLLCGLIFWAAAVLLQPAQLEQPPENAIMEPYAQE